MMPYQMADEEDPKLLETLTQGTSQQVSPVQQQVPTEQPPTMPPPLPGAPIAALKPQSLPGMPPEVTADDLEPYLNKQKESLGKYGADDLMGLEKQTMADRNSLGNRVTSGLKGLGDAVMMGVAGAGNPGWQKQFEDQQDERAKEQLGVMGKAHEMNREDTEAGMKLDALDAKSPLSKAAQQNFGHVLSKNLGIPQESISKMSAAQIENTAELGMKYADIQAQTELKKVMLQFEQLKANAEIENQKMGRQLGAAEALGKMGPLDKMMHPESKKQYESVLNGGTQGIPAPHGQTVRQNGKTYTWNGSTYMEQ